MCQPGSKEARGAYRLRGQKLQGTIDPLSVPHFHREAVNDQDPQAAPYQEILAASFRSGCAHPRLPKTRLTETVRNSAHCEDFKSTATTLRHQHRLLPVVQDRTRQQNTTAEAGTTSRNAVALATLLCPGSGAAFTGTVSRERNGRRVAQCALLGSLDVPGVPPG